MNSCYCRGLLVVQLSFWFVMSLSDSRNETLRFRIRHSEDTCLCRGSSVIGLWYHRDTHTLSMYKSPTLLTATYRFPNIEISLPFWIARLPCLGWRTPLNSYLCHCVPWNYTSSLWDGQSSQLLSNHYYTHSRSTSHDVLDAPMITNHRRLPCQ